MSDIFVIGGGPAGLMAAATAAMNGATVTLADKNDIPGKKLLITGKGRCNVTNACDEQTLLANVAHNPKFLYGAFYRFNSQDTMRFFESLGIELKVERGNRVFPASDRAKDIRDALLQYVRDCGVQVICDEILSVRPTEHGVSVVGTRQEYSAKSCIIATGGLSYPETGSTGDGYKFAKEIGHKIVPTAPSLIGLKCRESFCAELSGLTLKNIAVSFYQKGQKLYEDFGELLFTHVGISGPTVLSASAHFDHFTDAEAIINFKPALTPEQLDKRLLRDFDENINKDILNALEGLLPKKLLPVVLERAGLNLHQKVHQITKEARENLVNTLQHFAIELIGKENIKRAIITAGGISTDEVSPKTMASKLCDKIYFAGEILDVDAYTGGFNLQIAFSTGYVAGESAAEVNI